MLDIDLLSSSSRLGEWFSFRDSAVMFSMTCMIILFTVDGFILLKSSLRLLAMELSVKQLSSLIVLPVFIEEVMFLNFAQTTPASLISRNRDAFSSSLSSAPRLLRAAKVAPNARDTNPIAE